MAYLKTRPEGVESMRTMAALLNMSYLAYWRAVRRGQISPPKRLHGNRFYYDRRQVATVKREREALLREEEDGRGRD